MAKARRTLGVERAVHTVGRAICARNRGAGIWRRAPGGSGYWFRERHDRFAPETPDLSAVCAHVWNLLDPHQCSDAEVRVLVCAGVLRPGIRAGVLGCDYFEPSEYRHPAGAPPACRVSIELIRSALRDSGVNMRGAKANPMPTAEDFRHELFRIMADAQNAGLDFVEITATELHERVGGYPGGNHRMPDCCQVMKAQIAAGCGDVILNEPPRGQGPTLTIRYRLPRLEPLPL